MRVALIYSLSVAGLTAAFAAGGVTAARAQAARPAQADVVGVLLLAHGGKPAWNDTVSAIAAEVDRVHPTAVAFGMASKASIAAAIDTLVARGVTRIRAVPLFVSSHSSVITSTEYLLGLRETMPPDLATFARMTHGASNEHAMHHADLAPPDLAPIAVPVPVTMGPALDDDPVVSDILAARARTISEAPANEVVILIAHGPVPDDENQQWLATMKTLADRVAATAAYARVEYQTVRDDAPAPVRDQASAELRARVAKADGEGHRVLIVPQLLAYGGIEAGIRTRLEGLTYTMSPAALAPDPRLVTWVLRSAEVANKEQAAGASH